MTGSAPECRARSGPESSSWSGRTGSCAALTISSRRRRLSSRGTSTLECPGRDVRRRAQAAVRCRADLSGAARAEVPELTRLGHTLDAWREELLAYWTPTRRRGVSNGPTEAVNALIKRVGHGFRNLRQLPAAVASRRRLRLEHRRLAGSARHPDPRPLTTLGGVEPLYRRTTSARDCTPSCSCHAVLGSLPADATGTYPPSPSPPTS